MKKRQCTTVLKVCAIQDCMTNTKSVKVTTIGTIEELEKLLNCDVSNKNFDDGIPLCSIHYNEFYRHINLAAPCASCGVLPGGGKKFFRHPPNSILVNRLLDNIDSPVNDCDVICKSCYDFHRSLISNSTTQTSSSDEHLLTIIEDLSEQVSPLPTQNEAELTLWALNKTALNVAAEIKCNHALLMTSVYNEFLQTIKNCCKTCSVINPPSIRWVLAQIVLKLSPHLSFVCKVKREGTILYRNNGDIMCALSHSLAENKSHNCFSNTTSMVNNLLHEQSNSFTQQYKGHHQTLSEMSLDNIIASTNPELWKFLTQLTQSKRQRQRRSLSFSSHDVHTVRTLYCLCVLLFTTNPQCCVPIHLPLTDLILCHGGTTELVTVLNRFGAVASVDTHSRFLQDLSADRKAMLDHNLSPNAFRIVSVDNRCSAVTCTSVCI